ncbi:MAG: hypothetical protein Phog2KO_17990 [Phototrophicaceae bacterium]
MWLKWSFAPKPFTPTYVLGFIVVAVMLITILIWLITGCQGWRNIVQSYWHIAWVIFATLLTAWSIISQYWAFGINDYSGLAQSASLQLFIVLLFSIVIIAVAPSPKIILGILIFSMLFQGVVGGLQVIFQQNIGLDWLGEFALDVSASGISVLEDNGTRWLRPYGLTPHPNILAGIISLGIFASGNWILQSGKKRLIGNIVFIIGFWCLLLTFSRGAWLGFAVAVFVVLPFVLSTENFWKKVLPTIISVFITGSIFVAIFSSLLISRTSINGQNTEMRSISDRLVYIDIALDAIEKYPLQGVGMANFPWYASNYIFYNTEYDLDGNYVHNIYLGIVSELGLIGFGLFMGMIVSAIGAIMRKRTTETIMLLAGFIAWAVMGVFDHFMWTLVLTQALWFGMLAVAMSGAVVQKELPLESA